MLNKALPILTFCLVALVATAANAQPHPSWDSRGWVLLGEREVNGRVDHDRIEVGRQDGKFNKLTMAVEDNDLELLSLRIVFADGTELDPRTNHYFREGQRTRVIDLPANERVIRYVDLVYRNTNRGFHAKVAVWGNKIADAPPPAPAWDPRGWVLLGVREVNGRVDHDRIDVGAYEGTYSKLTLVVEDNDLELLDFSIKFGEGAPWHPELRHYFREGQRSRQIDFPGDSRVIKHIDFTYRNLERGRRAKLAVYGWRTEVARPAAIWESRGWTLLGEREVHGHGRESSDRIEVGRGEGRYSKMTIVVTDADLEMIDLSVQFMKGDPWHPTVNEYFKEGKRTHVIDFPGTDDRHIRWIDFRYRNIPGEGHAKVQVWAK